MGIIIAIGGGEMKDLETLAIDKRIVEATGKVKPKALFIPTASHEAPGYIETFNQVYGGKLGCDTDVLLMIDHGIKPEKAKEKILSADLIYVGGGNTRLLLSEWRKYGIDKLLLEAYEQGIVLSGISAGSNCWFEKAQSDTCIYPSGDMRNYVTLDCLGIIKGFHCPHYNEDRRAEDMDIRISSYDGVAIVLDNFSAIEFNDDKYTIIKSGDDAYAYRMMDRDGVVIKEELVNVGSYEKTFQLLSKKYI